MAITLSNQEWEDVNVQLASAGLLTDEEEEAIKGAYVPEYTIPSATTATVTHTRLFSADELGNSKKHRSNVTGNGPSNADDHTHKNLGVRIEKLRQLLQKIETVENPFERVVVLRECGPETDLQGNVMATIRNDPRFRTQSGCTQAVRVAYRSSLQAPNKEDMSVAVLPMLLPVDTEIGSE